jgi:hypothetical protein
MVTRAYFRVSPTLGEIGLYLDDDGSHDALIDPLNNLDKVIFHPALRYPGVVAVFTGTKSLAAGESSGSPNFGYRSTAHNLVAHGQTGKPMMRGKLLGIGPGGADVDWAGTVPVQSYIYPGGSGSWSGKHAGQERWLTLGADDTNIIMNEQCNGDSGALPAMSIDWEVLVFDRNLDAALPDSGDLLFTNKNGPVEIETPKGSFTTAKRYKKLDTVSGFTAAFGKTISLRFNGTIGSGIYNTTTWKWSLGAGEYEVERRYILYIGPSPFDVHDRPAPAFTPDVKKVSI